MLGIQTTLTCPPYFFFIFYFFETLILFQTYFDSPPGRDPVALNMTTMGKGMVWINGESIGRYWVSDLNPLGKPSQRM